MLRVASVVWVAAIAGVAAVFGDVTVVRVAGSVSIAAVIIAKSCSGKG